jgi:hypothetical protein
VNGACGRGGVVLRTTMHASIGQRDAGHVDEYSGGAKVMRLGYNYCGGATGEEDEVKRDWLRRRLIDFATSPSASLSISRSAPLRTSRE